MPRRPARRQFAPVAAAAEVCEARRLLTTFVVTDGGDVTDAGDGELTYREALLAAEAEAGADVITFADDVTTVTLAADLGEFADDLTIDGGGRVTVDHGGFAGAGLTGGAFLLSGLRLNGADAASTAGDRGGALRVAGGATVTLDGVFFFGNAARDGGAVGVDGGSTLTVVGGAFDGNVARGGDHFRDGRGGAVRVDGGSSATFAGTVFNRNVASSGGGVALLNGSTGLFSDVRATRNVAGLRGGPDGELVARGADGGFLAVLGEFDGQEAAASAVVDGGRFTLNFAADGGGAIYAGGNLTLTGSVLSSNRALGRLTDDGGGAILAFYGDLTVADAVFFRNAADGDLAPLRAVIGDGADAGGLGEDFGRVRGGAVSTVSSFFVTVTGSTFTANAATLDGGALHLDAVARLTDVRMFRNEAGRDGGAVAADDGGVIADGGRYALNRAGRSGGGVRRRRRPRAP